jgi:hypothetical protein
MHLRRLIPRFAIVFAIALQVTAASAGVVATPAGYEVSYTVSMLPGTSNAGDIESVFIFETDGSRFNVDRGFDISGRGVTNLVHVAPFAPRSTLIAGIGRGIPGIGDGLDHIYLVVNEEFADSIVGYKWSEVFPGDAAGRTRHNEFIALLSDAALGDHVALARVTDFAIVDAASAWFDTSEPFAVSEFSIAQVPVGGNVPEPGTLVLVAAAMAALVHRHERTGRSRRHH